MNNQLQSMLYNFLKVNQPLDSASGTALASAARTATVSTSDITNYGGHGLLVFFDSTASAATPSIVMTIEGKDPASGKYYTILASAAITGTATNVYRVDPLLTAATNTIAKDLLPRTFRITMTHSDADSITYSVGYSIV